ncbi:MAG: hypothetical protein ACTHOC_10505 [Luteimonas sp.]
MPRSTRSSSASASFRPEARHVAWRPSRWVVAALLLLSVLAPFAVLASEMPRPAAWPLALVAAAFGLRAARREARRAPRRLDLPAGEGGTRVDGAVVDGVLLDGKLLGGVRLDGVPLAQATLAWRGPLAFLRWRDAAGRRGRLSWWPDTLPAAQRRVLKLWWPDDPGMAP